MKSKAIIFLSMVWCLLFSTTLYASTNHELNIKKGIHSILSGIKRENINNLNIGIIIQSMSSGKILYKSRENFLFTPASVQKLFTATASVFLLKPSYRFTTSLLTDGTVEDGVLHGNVTIKFTGDPELKLENLADLIAKLQKKGIKKIDGHVYIDSTDYNYVPYPPGWIWDDLSYGYAAPLNAIIIDRNKFHLKFIPGEPGHHPKLATDIPDGIVHFINTAITTSKIKKDCPITIYSDDQNYYRIGGCLDKRLGAQTRALAIRNMYTYASVIVKNLFIDNNIVYNGNIEFKATPPDSKLINTYYSPPLSKILKEMLKDSDNLTTNSVFKKIGEVYFNRQGTWQNSLRALKLILASTTGINFKENLIADGAGLSRYNLISPKQLSQLLYTIYKNSQTKKTILKALPIAGRDGTLEDRMLAEGRNERIHAKTGSMTGVSALAGYIFTKHNGVISFVIMINGFVGKRQPYIQLENQICEFLVNSKRSQHG